MSSFWLVVTYGGWQAGTSMAATQFAADTPLAVMGLIATGGIFMVWRFWIYAIAFLLMAFLLAGQWQRARVITDDSNCRFPGHWLNDLELEIVELDEDDILAELNCNSKFSKLQKLKLCGLLYWTEGS